MNKAYQNGETPKNTFFKNLLNWDMTDEIILNASFL